MLSQKRHFLKLLPQKIEIPLIHLSSDSSDSSPGVKSFKLSLIFPATFCQHFYTLLKSLADNNFHIF